MQPGVLENSDGTKYLELGRANAFLGLVRAGNAVVQTLDKSLRDQCGLGLHAFEILLFLAVFAEGHQLRMAELNQRAVLSQSQVSRVVAALESDGLVTRHADPIDSRAVMVSISDRGVASFKAAQDHHLRDLQEHVFARLTEEEIRQLGEITAKLLGGYATGKPSLEQ